MFSTSRQLGRRSFGPSGCQVPLGNSTCGETKTLDIINEFRRLYEQKLRQIDADAGGDCLQEKIKLQEEWIGDLTQQNEMLVRAVEELEFEATERVNLLETKLQQSAQNISEVVKRYNEHDFGDHLPFQLEEDVKSLLEFIRRAREDNKWCSDGLQFYTINEEELFGLKDNKDVPCTCSIKSKTIKTDPKVNCRKGNSNSCNADTPYSKRNCQENCNCEALVPEENQKEICDREDTINMLRKQLEEYCQLGSAETISKDLKCKTEECLLLRQAMDDMRIALTEEVASKHDTILALKRDVQALEERCLQADKQTAFKDDIIKELRKEIKQLKLQSSVPQDEPKKTKENSYSFAKNGETKPFLTINHSSQAKTKSTVIFIHKDENKEEEKSEKNDVEKPVKERSIFTMTKKIDIPNHLPVKKFVDNLEKSMNS